MELNFPTHFTNREDKFPDSLLKNIQWGDYAEYLSTNYLWIKNHIRSSDISEDIITLEIFDFLLPQLTTYKSPSTKGNVYTPYDYAFFMAEKSLTQWITGTFSDEPFKSSMDIINYFNNTHEKEKAILIKKIRQIKILDPSVGTGVFLIAVANILFEILIKFCHEFTLNEFKCQIIGKNLFGIDIDRLALNICKMKLFLWTDTIKTKITSSDATSFNIFHGDSLIGRQNIPREGINENSSVLDSQYDNEIHHQFPIYRLQNVNKSKNPLDYLSSISNSFFKHINFKYFVLEGNRALWNQYKNKLNEKLRRRIKFSVSNQQLPIFKLFAVFSKPFDFMATHHLLL
jgi:hypothetical protein